VQTVAIKPQGQNFIIEITGATILLSLYLMLLKVIFKNRYC